MRTVIVLTETLGIAREHEPVHVGVPLPKGTVRGTPSASVEGRAAQTEVLARWGDGSVKWLLLDFAASCPAGATRRAEVEISEKASAASGAVTAETSGGAAKVATDRLAFSVKSGETDFLASLATAQEPKAKLGLGLVLGLAGSNVPQAFAADEVELEATGPQRATVRARFKIPAGLDRPLDAAVRVHACAGFPALLVQVTLTNPNASVREILGRWPLGSKGAAYLKTFGLRLNGAELSAERYSADAAAPWQRAGKVLRIEQESSGGLHWDMRTHLNRHEKVPQRYAGYRVFSDGAQAGANFRAEPWVEALAGGARVGLGIREFWQNFPIALDTSKNAAAQIEFFSATFGGGEIELQGGEAKTWDALIALTPENISEEESRRLQAACVAPLTALPAAEALESSRAEGPFVRRDDSKRPVMELAAISMIRDSKRNVFTQREVIDEYGWRNYGDLWADNERGCKNAPRESQLVISHYNQEYDWGFGMVFQALRNAGVDGEAAADWFALGRAALRHEADVDTYHCWPREQAQDGVYCGGHFTHTAHGVEPGDATHRGAPTDKYWNTADWPWGRGGGPESGHFHTRGQWLLYYLTGDRRHRETALECTACVEYKIGEDKFPQTDNVGRDSGHNLQILTDAFAATGDEKFLRLAEKVLSRASFRKQWQEKLAKNPYAGDFSNSIYLRECARLLDVLADHGRAPDAPLYRATLESLTGYLDTILELGWLGPQTGFASQVRAESKRAEGARTEPKIVRRSNDSWNFIPTNGWLADDYALAAAHVADEAKRARYLEVARAAFDLDQRASQGDSLSPIYRNAKVATAFCRGSVAAAALTEP